MALPKFDMSGVLPGESGVSWGPPSSAGSPDASFSLGPVNSYPFDPSTKQERLGRVCDFTYATFHRIQRDGRGMVNVGGEEEADFRFVDSRPVKVNRFQNRFGRRAPLPRRGAPNVPQHQGNQQNRGGMMMQGQGGHQQPNQRQHQQQAQRLQWQRNNRQRQLAEWSIEPQQDWTLVEARQLSTLPKLSIAVNGIRVEDIEWRGELKVVDKAVDRILPKLPVPLTDVFSQNNVFYWPGTADDSILVNAFDNDPSITVAATDQILACLMSASQSRISWHLVFHKANGRLFIDKHNGTSVDLVTVDETNKEPPLSDNPTRINRPAELGAEALKINQNFSQQVFGGRPQTVCSYPAAPFVESKDKPAAKVFRYRVFTLPGHPHASTPFAQQPIKLVTRAEIDGVLPGTTDGYVTVRALNEYNPYRSGRSWKAQLESQKGALIAQETKNNHCKVGKWVAQALIAGCEHLKIGFVTRVSPDTNTRHAILNVQTYKVRELGAQIGLQEETAWGIVRGFIDMVMAQPDGRYTLVKDPVKPEVKLYRTSFDLLDSSDAEASPIAEGDSVPVAGAVRAEARQESAAEATAKASDMPVTVAAPASGAQAAHRETLSGAALQSGPTNDKATDGVQSAEA